MIFFIDTEFTELLPIENDPKLISIALVSVDGKHSFYAELKDHFSEDECSEFVIEAVLPLLDAENATDRRDQLEYFGGKLTFDECRAALAKFIEDLPVDRVDAYSDAPNFDWPFVQELFNGHPWPQKLAHQPISIYSIVDMDSFERQSETIYEKGKHQRHHALHDAQVMRLAYLSRNRL